MPIKDCKTEQLIRDTAWRLFLKEGKMMATTQDIADAAGVARPLLHYYFRSRESLFNQVFLEAVTSLRDRLHIVLESDGPFRQKIGRFVDTFQLAMVEAPYLETFIVLQLNQDPSRYHELFITLPGGADRIQRFLTEIEGEMERGTIPAARPIHFFMNLFALLSYPMIARPIYQNMFGLNDEAFHRLIGERKAAIMAQLFC